MKLYLLRHGKAVRDEEDRTRPLAHRGEVQTTWLGEAMAARGFTVDRVLHSPLTRARQTAERFLAAFPGLAAEQVDGLMPCDDVEPWVKRLARGEEDLLLVGHNPFMEELAQTLAGEYVRFRTSTLVALERPAQGRWKVLWTETPPRQD